MPNKLQAYAEQAERTARQITGSHLAWTAFLTTAARLYKYPYNEQLMIYMQRPEATACAEYDFWNEKMGRYVRRGSTGIALIDATGYKPRLKYVFDVSDTGGKENARRVNLWELKDAHTDSVSAMLERNYGVSGKNGLAEQFESVASQLAAEYWRDHSRDILGIVADPHRSRQKCGICAQRAGNCMAGRRRAYFPAYGQRRVCLQCGACRGRAA